MRVAVRVRGASSYLRTVAPLLPLPRYCTPARRRPTTDSCLAGCRQRQRISRGATKFAPAAGQTIRLLWGTPAARRAVR